MNKLKVISFSLLFLFLLIPISDNLVAQNLNNAFFPEADRIIRIAEKGVIADSINVWGDVSSAGRYLIPSGTRLPELISYGFGPEFLRTGGAELDWAKVSLQIKISRFNRERQVVDLTMFKYQLEEREPVEMFNYKLQNNDIVTIRVRRKPGFLDVLRVIGPIAALAASTALIIDRL